MENNMSDLANTANQVARSAVAVIDTVTARGAFKGEELSTIGRLRDQCTQLIALAEAEMGVSKDDDASE